MEESQTASLSAKVGALLFFAIATLASIAWFLYGTFQLIHQLINRSPVATFDNSVITAFGAGIALATLTFGIVYQGFLKLDLSERLERKISRALIGGILVMLLLPKAVDYTLKEYLLEEGYRVCPQASHIWMLYRKIVYVSTPSTCAALEDS